MAHDGTGTGWDTAAPADTDDRKDGAKEIRDLRKAVGIRVDKEHVACAATSVGGEHKMGSAVAYHNLASTFPTNKPDGATALDSDDEGRLAIVDGILYMWDGTTWLNLGGSIAIGSAYTSNKEVEIPFQWIMIHHDNGQNGVVMVTPLVDETVDMVIVGSTGTAHVVNVRSQQASTPYGFDMKCATLSGTFRWRVVL